MDEKNPDIVRANFLNSCKTAKNTIGIWKSVYQDAQRDYHCSTITEIINFILENIEFVKNCKIEHFGYNIGNL